MVSHRYDSSAQWRYVNANYLTELAAEDLIGFKSNKVNYQLALWDPTVNGPRYLKSLTYNLATVLSEPNWTRLRRTHNRDVGDPISVRYNGESVCLDYLQAVLELEFIAGHVDLEGARILEIGAGYGRTAHTLLSNHAIASYHIIDLPNSLRLARKYLRTVLDDPQFAKVHFRSNDEVDSVTATERFDLCVNIDSMAEMDPDVARSYLALIAERCQHFYTKNPVGKYLDKNLDGHFKGADVVALALRTGLLRDIIDIDDSRAVDAQAARFVRAYRPDEDWTCVAQSWAAPWSFYWQALYRSGSDHGER